MYSVATRQRGKAQGNVEARPVPVPLPLSGIFSDASEGEVAGLFAAELENFRSDGVVLKLRRSVKSNGPPKIIIQRVPYEFGGDPRYIELRPDRAQCLDGNGLMVQLMRDFTGGVMSAYISSHAVMVDGMGDPVLYSGTSMFRGIFTTLTTVNPSEFDGVIAHHDRLYFWKTNGGLEFYYGDVGAVTGPLARFPLDRLGNITGQIIAMAPMTIDAGNNTNDVLVIFTSTGHIVIYSGLDPGSDFDLVSRLKIAPPLSRFCAASVGGDLWIVTSAGIVSVADAMQRGVLALKNKITRPITPEIMKLVKTGGEWQLHAAADGSHVVLNHWDGAAAKQFIYEIETSSWTTANYFSRYWHNLALDTDFTSGTGLLNVLSEDDDVTELITATWVSSWFRVGGSGQIAWLKPTIIAKGPLTVTLTVLADHNETATDIAEASQTITIEPERASVGGSRVSLDEIIAVGAVGSTFQLRIEITAAWAKIVNLTAGVI